MSGGSAPELSITPFCLHLAAWDFRSTGEAVSTSLVPVSLPNGSNVADDDVSEGSMLDDVTVDPNMNTSRVAVSGIVGAVGGAKTKAERNCGTD